MPDDRCMYVVIADLAETARLMIRAEHEVKQTNDWHRFSDRKRSSILRACRQVTHRPQYQPVEKTRRARLVSHPQPFGIPRPLLDLNAAFKQVDKKYHEKAYDHEGHQNAAPISSRLQ